MPQLHLYVPEDTAVRLKEQAQAKGLSLSRYLAELIQHQVGSSWPEDFFEQVVGGWQGEPLERSTQGEFEPRERW